MGFAGFGTARHAELEHRRPAVPRRVAVLGLPLDASLEVRRSRGQKVVALVAELLLQEVVPWVEPPVGEACLVAHKDRKAHDLAVRPADLGVLQIVQREDRSLPPRPPWPERWRPPSGQPDGPADHQSPVWANRSRALRGGRGALCGEVLEGGERVKEVLRSALTCLLEEPQCVHEVLEPNSRCESSRVERHVREDRLHRGGEAAEVVGGQVAAKGRQTRTNFLSVRNLKPRQHRCSATAPVRPGDIRAKGSSASCRIPRTSWAHMCHLASSAPCHS